MTVIRQQTIVVFPDGPGTSELFRMNVRLQHEKLRRKHRKVEENYGWFGGKGSEATEATEEITEQNNASDPPLASDNSSIQEQPFPLGCASPFTKQPPNVDEIKQKAQEIKEKTQLH